MVKNDEYPKFFSAKIAMTLTQQGIMNEIIEDNDYLLEEIYEKINFAINRHNTNVVIPMVNSQVMDFLKNSGFQVGVIRDRVVLSWGDIE